MDCLWAVQEEPQFYQAPSPGLKADHSWLYAGPQAWERPSPLAWLLSRRSPSAFRLNCKWSVLSDVEKMHVFRMKYVCFLSDGESLKGAVHPKWIWWMTQDLNEWSSWMNQNVTSLCNVSGMLNKHAGYLVGRADRHSTEVQGAFCALPVAQSRSSDRRFEGAGRTVTSLWRSGVSWGELRDGPHATGRLLAPGTASWI